MDMPCDLETKSQDDLFAFLMKGHLVATGAEFLDFHLGGMGLLISGGDVVAFAAFAAL